MFQVPNKKETYMSPVLHIQNDQSAYLLFGSGGETVPGNLYIMPLPDFYNYVTADLFYKRPFFNGSYENDLKVNHEEVVGIKGLYSLYKSESKGVMVPPILVDVDNDGCKDMLVSSFDGDLILFNGKTFDIIWKIKFECYETYTSPSPGFFNDDKFLDFMFIQNYGTFDRYLNSSVLVISGIDGSILWEMGPSPRMEMASPLTIQTNATYRDIFFVRVQGNTLNIFRLRYYAFPFKNRMKRN